MGKRSEDYEAPVREHTWKYINLDEFKAGGFTIFAYIALYIGILISIACYVADIYTAVLLLAFNKWSSKVSPAIPFYISKWIFAGSIIFGFAYLTYEWIRAIRVIKRDSVSECYLDRLANGWCAVRSRGFRRFCLFAKLTKSKKGADYSALFVYFSFKTWVGVAFAHGPRVVVNGVTLYEVTRVRLVPGAAKGGIGGFFANLKALADENVTQTLILSSMLFTTIVWVFTVLALLAAVIIYLTFLWHHIPNEFTLHSYCKHQIDKRLGQVIQIKHEKEARKMQKDGKMQRQPTLPVLLTDGSSLGEQKPSIPDFASSSGASTYSTPSSATSATSLLGADGLQRQPTLPDLNAHPVPAIPRSAMQRTQTMGTISSINSTNSYSSTSGLLPNRQRPGIHPLGSPNSSSFNNSSYNGMHSYNNPYPNRSGTSASFNDDESSSEHSGDGRDNRVMGLSATPPRRDGFGGMGSPTSEQTAKSFGTDMTGFSAVGMNDGHSVQSGGFGYNGPQGRSSPMPGGPGRPPPGRSLTGDYPGGGRNSPAPGPRMQRSFTDQVMPQGAPSTRQPLSRMQTFDNNTAPRAPAMQPPRSESPYGQQRPTPPPALRSQPSNASMSSNGSRGLPPPGPGQMQRRPTAPAAYDDRPPSAPYQQQQQRPASPAGGRTNAPFQQQQRPASPAGSRPNPPFQQQQRPASPAGGYPPSRQGGGYDYFTPDPAGARAGTAPPRTGGGGGYGDNYDQYNRGYGRPGQGGAF